MKLIIQIALAIVIAPIIGWLLLLAAVAVAGVAAELTGGF